ncbi:MAG: pyridoxamine 5'-phosphate oxidase family protein [Desulfobulbus sp.]|nr:pyridoxamine 5'-phosphate oxidase family protein [Desulfobulbus sp.]
MIPEKLLDVMQHEGVVAIVTQGENEPHLVNTWNSYLTLSTDHRLLIPAGGMHTTEANIANNPNVLLTVGSREVSGMRGPGTGFLIRGKAAFVTSGPDYDGMKAKFAWMRAVLAITIESVTQTL